MAELPPRRVLSLQDSGLSVEGNDIVKRDLGGDLIARHPLQEVVSIDVREATDKPGVVMGLALAGVAYFCWVQGTFLWWMWVVGGLFAALSFMVLTVAFLGLKRLTIETRLGSAHYMVADRFGDVEGFVLTVRGLCQQITKKAEQAKAEDTLPPSEE